MSCILCAIKTHHRINGALSRLQTELTASRDTTAREKKTITSNNYDDTNNIRAKKNPSLDK